MTTETFIITGNKQSLLQVFNHELVKAKELKEKVEKGETKELYFGLTNQTYEGSDVETLVNWIEKEIPGLMIQRIKHIF